MSFDINNYHLKSIALSDFLSSKENLWMKGKMIRKEFVRGEYLIRENSFSKGVFVIRKGKVKIFHTNGEGKHVIVYIYRKGDFFGYRPLLADGPNPVSAVAMENTVVSFIAREPFMKILDESPTLSRRLLTVLSKEFSVWINKITIFSQHAVKERVAMALLILDNVYNGYNEKYKSAAISISREDFAGFVGTAKETLVRTLRKFKDEKIISAKGSKILILKHKVLFKIADEI